MFMSNSRSVGTSAIPLTPPSPTKESYGSGFSVLIKNTHATAKLIVGHQAAQHFEIDPGVSQPFNDFEDGEVIWIKSSTGSITTQEAWQGL